MDPRKYDEKERNMHIVKGKSDDIDGQMVSGRSMHTKKVA